MLVVSHHIVLAQVAHHLWRRVGVVRVLASSAVGMVVVCVLVIHVRLMEWTVTELTSIGMFWQATQMTICISTCNTLTKLEASII